MWEDAYLAPFLFVPSKELSNLIHETRCLLFPPEPEGALPWGACCSHASSCRSWVGLTFSSYSIVLLRVSPSPQCLHPVLLLLQAGLLLFSRTGAVFEGVAPSVPGHHGTWGWPGQVVGGPWGPWLWLGSRHSFNLQWLCQSLPPSAWAGPLFLYPSASPRPQGQQGLSLSLHSHPDAKRPAALWGHCWIGHIYFYNGLGLDLKYSHPD